MTTINPTYILIASPVVAGRATIFPISVGRNISQAQDIAEQTSAMIQREVGRLLQLALAAAQLPGVTPASGSVYALPGAVRSELTDELANLDAPVSSRLPTASYTAPDNAGIAALPTLAEIEAVLPVAPTAAANAAAILAAAMTTPIAADVQKINGVEVVGTGITSDKWRGVQP